MSRSLTHYKFIFVQDRRQDSLSFLSMKQDIAYPRLAANSLRSTGWPWTFGSSFWVLGRGCTALCRFHEVQGSDQGSVCAGGHATLYFTVSTHWPAVPPASFVIFISPGNVGSWLFCQKLTDWSCVVFLQRFFCSFAPYLFLRQHNAVLVSGICMYFEIRFMIPTTWFFLVRTALVVIGLLYFHVNFRTHPPLCYKVYHRDFSEDCAESVHYFH